MFKIEVKDKDKIDKAFKQHIKRFKTEENLRKILKQVLPIESHEQINKSNYEGLKQLLYGMLTLFAAFGYDPDPTAIIEKISKNN